MIQTQARNATLVDLVEILRVQHASKVDKLVSAGDIVSVASHDAGYSLLVNGMGLDGFDAGRFNPTDIFDEHLADKLSIPLAYLRRIRKDRSDILDANVNGWLQGWQEGEGLDVNDATLPGPDTRNFLLRAFTDTDTGVGIARGLCSDRFRIIDHLDAITGVLEGAQQAGVEITVDACQLTERRMSVDFICPDVAVKAGDLLANYRSPFNQDGVKRNGGWDLERARAAAANEGKGFKAGDEPVLWAGFQMANSELAGGAFTLCPRVVINVCRNGLKLTEDIFRKRHLGAKLDAEIDYSSKTQELNLEMIVSQTTDLVRAWLAPEYVENVVTRLAAAEGPLSAPPAEAIEKMCTHLHYTEEQRNGILSHFIMGGQMTKIGVVNAITSFAQTVDSPDAAHDLEANALDALAVL